MFYPSFPWKLACATPRNPKSSKISKTFKKLEWFSVWSPQNWLVNIPSLMVESPSNGPLSDDRIRVREVVLEALCRDPIWVLDHVAEVHPDLLIVPGSSGNCLVV